MDWSCQEHKDYAVFILKVSYFLSFSFHSHFILRDSVNLSLIPKQFSHDILRSLDQESVPST